MSKEQMLIKQRTIGKEVSMSGIGIHTGHECKMTFKPAPENYGLRFIRTDLGGNPEIPAVVDHVIDISQKPLVLGKQKFTQLNMFWFDLWSSD